MEIKIYLLSIIICSFACEQIESGKNNAEVDSSEVSSLNNSAENTIADSIDRTNNESLIASEGNVSKAYVFLSEGDSTIHLFAEMKKDHRVFGFSRPDIKSEKLLLLSIFTNDIENNPFACKLGAYYDTREIRDFELKYLNSEGDFVKAAAVENSNEMSIIYFEKKWFKFE